MGFSKFEHVKISAIAGVVPEKVINIDDEIEFYNNNPKLLERNKKILGLGTRHVVENDTTTVDLCEAAAIKLLREHNIDKSNIDAVIVVSTSHDYVYPASSCLLQGLLDLPETCMCFDISGLACSGYVHGLLQAHSLIESGAIKNCLLLCGDTPSKFTDVRNRISNMLFGDMGTATYLEYSKNTCNSYFYTGTQGKLWENLIAPAGGRKLPIRNDIADIEIVDKNGNVWHLWDDMMQGMNVFKFTMDVGPRSVEALLKYTNNKIEDIDFFAIHQANGQIVKTVAMHSKIPKEKYSSKTFSEYGNCAAASVISVLCNEITSTMNNVLLCTFGVGLSYGSAILDFSDLKNYGISTYQALRKNLTREEQIKYWINKFMGENND